MNANTLWCLIEGGLNSRGGGDFFSKSNKRREGGVNKRDGGWGGIFQNQVSS